MPEVYTSRILTVGERKELIFKGLTDSELDGIQIATATPYGEKRIEEGIEKITQALLNDYKESQSKKSSLPPDWRTRLIK
jgi:hypothetical protein